MSTIGHTAKEQVKILLRIYDVEREFYVKNERRPNALYIGQEDFCDMMREIEPWEVGHKERLAYRGMQIFRVDAAHHLNVSFIDRTQESK